jgi:hypothetical protein
MFTLSSHKKIVSMMHCWKVAFEIRKLEEKETIKRIWEDKRHFALNFCCKKPQITSLAKVYKWHALFMLHSKLCQQYFCTLHSTKCKTLNLKCHKFHFILTLIPNQSYAEMHWLCVAYAYLGISIHECLNVHIGIGNSCLDINEH